MNKIFSSIPNLYFFPFIFALNTWKSKRTLADKILLLCSDLFVYTPLWIAGWLLFFGLFGIVFYLFDKDFKNVILMLFLFLFFGFIIPGFYLIKYLLRVHQIKKIFLILLPFFAIYIVVTQFIIAPSGISGNSMSPTLKNRDGIWIKKYNNNYQSGDIIIFKSSKNPDIEYISRLIALPKDKIKIQQGKVYLNGKLLQEPYTKTPTNLWEDGFVKEGEEYKIPDNEIFVMGDNRPRSSDSREFGFINISLIIGKYSNYKYWEGK